MVHQENTLNYLAGNTRTTTTLETAKPSTPEG